MVSLVNAARVAAGKGGVGWLNPTLYKYSSQFSKDVTSGNNRCVEGGGCCPTGFTATTGWDPVTGWGSINFANFKALLTSLGNQLNIPTVAPVTAPVAVAPNVQGTRKPSATASPTVSNTGWMYKYTYGAKQCGGSVLSVTANPLGVCLGYYSTTGGSYNLLGYKMYSCNGGKTSALFEFYSFTLIAVCVFQIVRCSQRILFLSSGMHVRQWEFQHDYFLFHWLQL